MLAQYILNKKFLSLLLWCAAIVCPPAAHAQPSVKLGDVQITASQNTPPTLEIGLSGILPSGATAALASPDQHAAAGFAYPLWLSDAVITIKQRKGQPQAVVIQTKRSPPTLQHDLLLTLSSNGANRLIPYIFLTDAMPPTAADLAMPRMAEAQASAASAAEPLPTLGDVIAGLGRQAASATAINQSPRPSAAAPIVSSTTRIARPAAKKARRPAPALAAAAAPIAAAVSARTPPAPEVVASEPTVPFTATPTLPASAPAQASPLPATAAAPAMQQSRSGLTWFSDPLTLALAAGALLLLAYLIIRLWMTKRAQQTKNAPLLTRETGFQPTAQGAANTVFGLSDTEAVAMQQQWVQQQMGKKP